MPLRSRFVILILFAWIVFSFAGCSPDGQQDDEKEPHFLLGKSRVQAMDYQGAIEAFEDSLDVNPHSAAAHFELAWLYDEKESDPAAAIYHYRQYLKYNPNASNADVVRQRITSCKQQLAADVLPLPSAPAAQQQLEKLAEQNRQLQDEVNKWRAWYATQTTKTNSIPEPLPKTAVIPDNPPAVPQNNSTETPTTPRRAENPTPAATHSKTHAVLAGETASAICRKFGVKLSALQSANPGVNLSKIRVGQVLNLP
ncbi:MAG TPA: LysM peptidoglycan-binding domain-containing protein [Verrucomicrobiae bacterium]|nr:LysM peptidoglycan-binding domain-containing protein [Verrucomicrobiae bacterium]